MFGEDATHHVLVQFDTERMANLLGNPQMAEIRVSGFHLDDCRDQFCRLGPLARACDEIGRTRTVAGTCDRPEPGGA